MVEALIRWSLRRSVVVIAISALVLLAGVWATMRTPVDVLPDLTAPSVTVVVEAPGLATEEVERLVTFPIETAVNGANDVRRVRSATALGIAVVWVEFEWGTDVHRARQTVAERLTGIAGALPAIARAPKLAPMSSILGEVLFVGLTSDRHDALELRQTAVTLVRRRLLGEPGISQVTPIGGDVRQFQVVLEPALLRAYDVAAADVVDALERANENVSAGFLVRGAEEALVQGVGRIADLADVEETVVAERGARAVRVRDLGLVRIGAGIQRGLASVGRRDATGAPIVESGVVLAVQKQPGVNTLELTRRLDRAVTELQAAVPEGMVLNANLFRQADFIQAAVRSTLIALIEGGIFVVAVVLLFLASFRASLITLLAIPMSLAVAMWALRLLGGDINTMTLGGMAIAIGALVDDAIIDVENVVRRLREERGKPEAERRTAFQVVYDASVEVRASIVFATVLILLVFSPIFALSGVEGRLLRPLGVAFSVGLAASLFTALTLTPALCLWLLPKSRTVLAGRDPRFVGWVKRAFRPSLDFALRHPWMVLVPTLLALGWATVTVARAGRNFLPEFNEGALTIGLITAPGTSLAESDALARRAETALMRHPEIAAMGRRTGRAEEDEHVQGVEASEIDLTLDMHAPQRQGLPVRSKDELLAALRADLAKIPGIQATFGQPISHRIDHMLSGSRASVAVKVFGPDLDTLRGLARDVERAMQPIAGVVDLSIEPQVDVPSLRLDVDRAALARHGLSVEAVNRAIERAARGEVATRVLEESAAYDLVVQVGDPRELTQERLAAAQVETPSGARVPLGSLVHVRDDASPNFVMRENAERRIVVQCNVAGRDVTGVVDDVRRAVAGNVELPRGYWIGYGGQFESAQETTRRLTILSALVLLGMAGLLIAVLRSVRDALLVLVNLPLALIGGVAGLAISGGTLSIASLIGFITVFGVAARSGILLVSHVRHLQRHEGVTDFEEAVRRGALERVSPILMTALAAGLALVPLALRGDEPGSEILTPMAIVILFGLISSTFLNMVVVPTLLLRFGSARTHVAAPLAALVIASCAANTDPHGDWDRTAGIVRNATGVEDVRAPGAAMRDVALALENGLTRDEALRLVLAGHPRVEAAFHEVGVARADLAQAGLLSNPSLSFLFLFPSGGGRTQLEGSLLQSVSDLWQIPAREAHAERALDARVIDAARTAAELALAAGEAHDAALVARERAAIAEAALDLARRAATAAQARSETGAVRGLDVELARADALHVELALERTRRELGAACARLSGLLALDRPLTPADLAGDLPAPTTDLLAPEALAARALDLRLDLRAARAEAEAAAALVPLERRRALPELALGLHGERDVAGDEILGPAVDLTLPIFDTGDAAIARAERAYAAKAALWRALASEAAHDVLDAAAAAHAAQSAARLARDEFLPQSERVARLAADAHARGDVPYIAWRESERALLAARSTELDARAELARACSHLERAAGAPLALLAAPTDAPERP